MREREVEDLFAKYGRIRAVDLKSPVRPPAYAFIEFDDPRCWAFKGMSSVGRSLQTNRPPTAISAPGCAVIVKLWAGVCRDTHRT